ncbi:MAG: GNAT family N-acetyltransferase, partial [Bacillota bacterium]
MPLVPSARLSRSVSTPGGQVILEGPLSREELQRLNMDAGLDWFRPAWRQKEALEEVAAMDEGRVWVARHDHTIVGYVVIHPPHPFERWGRDRLPGILELGAVEVSPAWRRSGLAT